VTNTVGAIELARLTARVSQEAAAAAVVLLGRVDLMELTPASLALPGQLPPPEVRTLDALHIASARIRRLGVQIPPGALVTETR